MSVKYTIVYVCLVATSLSGCLATSPVASQQANNSAKILSALDLELTNFRAVQKSIQDARIESLNNQNLVISRVEYNEAIDAISIKAAGGANHDNLKKTLIENVTAIDALRVKTAASRSDYAAKVAALLAPLPNTSSEITSAQNKAVAMGTELDSSTRVNELKNFISEVQKNIKENRKKIVDGQNAGSLASTVADTATNSATPPASTSSSSGSTN